MPQISVIMGVYNIADLAEMDNAVRSILNQTITDFEFIICDDGSTDSTWDLLEHYAKEDARIMLIKNARNQGLAFALNQCIQKATGKYLARQDADDISVPDRFEKQMNFLETHLKIDFVGSNVILYNRNGEWGKRKFPTYPEKKDFLFTMPFVHGVLMLRKDALELVNGYCVSKVTRRAEDYDLLMKMYAAGMKGANIQIPLYYFLEDEAAESRRKYRYRIDEAIVRWHGFRILGLMPIGMIYVIKPLIVGLIPKKILRRLKNKLILQ